MATPQDTNRKEQLKAIAEGYFQGIAKKDMSAVQYDDNVTFRSPLAPHGLGIPLVGKQTVLDWFMSLWGVVGDTQVYEHYFNEDLTVIATRADIEITDPPNRIRVIDRFMVTPEGKIVQQENHFDAKGGPADLESAF